MTLDPRDKMWSISFKYFFDCYFEELIADRLLQRWGFVDEWTKWIVVITASSSAVAGWAAWSMSGFDNVWVFLTSIAAISSITHASLTIPERIKRWEGTKKSFVPLRLNFQALREDMSVDPRFDMAVFQKRLDDLRNEYKRLMSDLGPEPLRTKRLETKVYSELNSLIEDQLE